MDPAQCYPLHDVHPNHDRLWTDCTKNFCWPALLHGILCVWVGTDDVVPGQHREPHGGWNQDILLKTSVQVVPGQEEVD